LHLFGTRIENKIFERKVRTKICTVTARRYCKLIRGTKETINNCKTISETRHVPVVLGEKDILNKDYIRQKRGCQRAHSRPSFISLL